MPLRVFIADDSVQVSEMLTELISAAGRVELGAGGYYDKVKGLGALTQRLAELADGPRG